MAWNVNSLTYLLCASLSLRTTSTHRVQVLLLGFCCLPTEPSLRIVWCSFISKDRARYQKSMRDAHAYDALQSDHLRVNHTCKEFSYFLPEARSMGFLWVSQVQVKSICLVLLVGKQQEVPCIWSVRKVLVNILQQGDSATLEPVITLRKKHLYLICIPLTLERVNTVYKYYISH